MLEFSQKNDDYFCLAEFENNVRIMGALSANSKPEIGQKVKLIKAGILNGQYSFKMNLL